MRDRRSLILAALVPLIALAMVLLSSAVGWSHRAATYGWPAVVLLLAIVLAVPALTLAVCDRLWLSRSPGLPNWVAMPLVAGPTTVVMTISLSALIGHLHFNAQWVLASLALGAIYGVVAGVVLPRPR
jgi:hypothetical protein